jgi:hypothetical protein
MPKKRSERLDEAAARRRIRFVISEARHGIRVADGAIAVALRVTSNFYAIGQDAQSGRVKELCRLMSREALKLYKRDRNAWRKGTVNEHPLPIGSIWTDIVARRKTITVDEVVEKFKRYGMVVVTLLEHDMLRPWHRLSPEERYKRARIKIMERGDDDKWRPFQRAISPSSSIVSGSAEPTVSPALP